MSLGRKHSSVQRLRSRGETSKGDENGESGRGKLGESGPQMPIKKKKRGEI